MRLTIHNCVCCHFNVFQARIGCELSNMWHNLNFRSNHLTRMNSFWIREKNKQTNKTFLTQFYFSCISSFQPYDKWFFLSLFNRFSKFPLIYYMKWFSCRGFFVVIVWTVVQWSVCFSEIDYSIVCWCLLDDMECHDFSYLWQLFLVNGRKLKSHKFLS